MSTPNRFASARKDDQPTERRPYIDAGFHSWRLSPAVARQRPRYLDPFRSRLIFSQWRGYHIDDVPVGFLEWMLWRLEDLQPWERHTIAYHLDRRHGRSYDRLMAGRTGGAA